MLWKLVSTVFYIYIDTFIDTFMHICTWFCCEIGVYLEKLKKKKILVLNTAYTEVKIHVLNCYIKPYNCK